MPGTSPKPITCDVFVNIIDNFGDAGVAWRLASELAAHGLRLRLITDDVKPFIFIAGASGKTPQTIESVTLITKKEIETAPNVIPAEVVIETFACRLPETYEAAIRKLGLSCYRINLDYFSCETWAQDCNGLPSIDPETGHKKINYFPGLGIKNAPVIIESDYLNRKRAFELSDFEARFKCRAPFVSFFGYETANLDSVAKALNALSSLTILLAPGRASEGLCRKLHARTVTLPYCAQKAFDERLWASDVNFVRGEDSCVRAVLAGRPFLWNIYPTEDFAHKRKLDAFLEAARSAFDSDADFLLWKEASYLLNGFEATENALCDFLQRAPLQRAHFERLASQIMAKGSFVEKLAQEVKNR